MTWPYFLNFLSLLLLPISSSFLVKHTQNCSSSHCFLSILKVEILAQFFPFDINIVSWLTFPSQISCALQNTCSLVKKCPHSLNNSSGTLWLDDTIFFTALLRGSWSFPCNSSILKLAAGASLFNNFLFYLLLNMHAVGWCTHSLYWHRPISGLLTFFEASGTQLSILCYPDSWHHPRTCHQMFQQNTSWASNNMTFVFALFQHLLYMGHTLGLVTSLELFYFWYFKLWNSAFQLIPVAFHILYSPTPTEPRWPHQHFQSLLFSSWFQSCAASMVFPTQATISHPQWILPTILFCHQYPQFSLIPLHLSCQSPNLDGL